VTTAENVVAITPASGEELVPLVHWVRADRASSIQAQIAHLLAEQGGKDSATYSPPYANTYGPKYAWDLAEWRLGEEPAAAWILSVLSTSQRRIVARLVASGSEGVWTSELRRVAGYDHAKGLSGVFKAIGGRFRATGHRPVWNGGVKGGEKGQLLAVLDENARTVFATVLKANFSDLAEEFAIS
jgi:hypothetical protein